MDQLSHPQDASSADTRTQTKTSPEGSLDQARRLTDQELYDRYFLAIRELSEEALQLGKPRVFLEAIGWEVSRIIDGYGLIAAGDFLRNLGHCVYTRSEVRRGQAEAAEAAQNGHKPS
jgi:hypothetical protein